MGFLIFTLWYFVRFLIIAIWKFFGFCPFFYNVEVFNWKHVRVLKKGVILKWTLCAFWCSQDEMLCVLCNIHTSYLSRTRGLCPCKFFLAGVNFYRFNAKIWHFRQILREKLAFFTDLTRIIGVFGCKFYSPKIVSV